MFFWQRREVWLGGFDGCAQARKALEDAGIACETRLVRLDRMLSPGHTSRGQMGGGGVAPQEPGMYYLYVARADAERARALLGTEELR